MFKKIFIGLAISFLLLTGGLRLMSISIFSLDETLDVATGLGAKLACSGKFITGLKEEQILADLIAYSPANRALRFEYSQSSVVANFWGLSQAKARYRSGLGCTLEHPLNQPILDELSVLPLNQSTLPWPKGNKVTTLSPAIQSLVEQILEQDNAQGLDTRALLVVHKGQVVAEHYATGYHAQTRFIGWSMAKSVSAMLFGVMQKQGILDTQTNRLFEAWQHDERKNITVKHLLTMTSGLAFDETYIPGADATHMLFLDPNMAKLPMQKPLQHPIGTHFSYASGTTNLLLKHMTQALDNRPQSLLNQFYQQLAAPLGLQNTVFEVDGDGIFVGSSYLFATARDWAKMGWVMANEGWINQQQVLPEWWVEQARTANSSQNDSRFGYQFWLNSGNGQLRWPALPVDTFAMQGSKKQRVMIFPQANAVIVRLGWSRSYPDDKNFSAILEALAKSP